jgi:hypothetical protein
MSDNATEAWLAEPFTIRMAAKLKLAERGMLEALQVVCRTSQDPKVVLAFARYEAAQRTLRLFEKGEY